MSLFKIRHNPDGTLEVQFTYGGHQYSIPINNELEADQIVAQFFMNDAEVPVFDAINEHCATPTHDVLAHHNTQLNKAPQNHDANHANQLAIRLENQNDQCTQNNGDDDWINYAVEIDSQVDIDSQIEPPVLFRQSGHIGHNPDRLPMPNSDIEQLLQNNLHDLSIYCELHRQENKVVYIDGNNQYEEPFTDFTINDVMGVINRIRHRHAANTDQTNINQSSPNATVRVQHGFNTQVPQAWD